MMEDAEIKKLREEQVEWADTLSHVEETKEKADTILMAMPNNLLVRLAVGLIHWVHKKCVVGEADARAAARKTWDR